MNQNIKNFIDSQLECWDEARKNYSALNSVQIKTFMIKGIPYNIQYNPSRIISSGAKVDKQSILNRKCFLCKDNLPKGQKGLDYKGRYTILLNPFPIFDRHLTIPDKSHISQAIKDRMQDMLDLAYDLNDFIIFYNGPKCGASAPDHAHFQAGNKGFLPIESYWHSLKREITSIGYAQISFLDNVLNQTLVIESKNKQDIINAFNIIYDYLPIHDNEEEPMVNILALYDNGQWAVFLFPREKHRPDCYFASGNNNILLSPASVDMGGVLITPLKKDFEKITERDIRQIMSEVSISKQHLELIIKRISAQKNI